MANLPDPKQWQPGDVVLHRDGAIVILAQRRVDDSGWLTVGGGRLGDRAVEASWVRFSQQARSLVWYLLYEGNVAT